MPPFPENTLLFNEFHVDEPWASAHNKPLTGLTNARTDGFLELMADGSVRFFNDSLPAETVRRLALRNDGQPISLD